MHTWISTLKRATRGVNDLSDEECLAAYLARVQKALATIRVEDLTRFVELIEVTVTAGAQVFFIGNGGSAATASHYVNDLVMAYVRTNRVARVSSLTDNPALVTGIANDYSFDQVFEHQLRALAQPGDLVIAISASGNSPNLVRAMEYARSVGLTTAAVLGFDGGKLKGIADAVVHVHSELGDYGPAEDAHLVINHAVAAAITDRGE